MENEINTIIRKEYNHRWSVINVLEFSFLRNYPGDLSFCGASILANSYKNFDFDEYWISKKDWDEYGSNIIFKKCKNISL